MRPHQSGNVVPSVPRQPMPDAIARRHRAGQKINSGELLVTIEAMNMETGLRAESAKNINNGNRDSFRHQVVNRIRGNSTRENPACS